MIHTVFEWREDKEFGGEGWIPKGFPDFNIVSGNTFGHDVMEHFPDGDGDLAHELLAMGSMLLIRGEGDWFSALRHGRNHIKYHLGSDLCNFFREGKELRTPPRTRKLAEHLEDDIDASVQEAIRILHAEADEDDELPDMLSIHRKFDQMRHWIRAGYRRARRRYYDNAPWELADCYDRVSAEVKRLHGDYDYGYVTELHIKVNPRTLEVKAYIEEVY